MGDMIRLDTVGYHVTLGALGNVSSWIEALSLLEDMYFSSAGCDPITFNSAVSTCEIGFFCSQWTLQANL